MKRILILTALALFAPLCRGQYVTLTGTLFGANGSGASNYTISFTPTQFGFIAGTGVLVNSTTNCYTSTDGSVVGLPNPLATTTVSASYAGGSLAAGNYYLKYAWYGTPSLSYTLPSPEMIVNLSATGQIIMQAPSSVPANVAGITTMMAVYAGTSPGSEVLQGTVTAGSPFTLTTLSGGASPSGFNATQCRQYANDTIWPVGTGYNVSLTDSSGNPLPGYPMVWQLLGAGTTLNLSTGLPYYHGIVTFPTPILASPLNHGLQSIASDLAFGGYSLRNVGQIGINTSFPTYTLDIELGGAGTINADTYYAGGTAGFTGTKVAGACTFTIKGGIIVNVTGC